MKRFWVTDWFIALLTGAVVFAAAQLTLLEGLERGAYDIGMRLSSRTPGDDIAIVAIDDASLSKLGAWPWSRDRYAEMSERLHEAGARVVGYDIPFTDPKIDPGLDFVTELIQYFSASSLRRKIPNELRTINEMLRDAEQRLNVDRNFAESLEKAGNVALTMPGRLGDSPANAELPEYVAIQALHANAERAPTLARLQPPLAEFGVQASAVGVRLRADDVAHDARRIPLVVRYAGNALPTFPLALAARYRGVESAAIGIGQGVQIDRQTVPTDGHLRMLSYFYRDRGDQAAFPVYSFADVLRGSVPAQRFQDKLVLIGPTADDLGERYSTPVAADLPGVITLAHAVGSILNRHAMVVPEWSKAVELGAFLLVLLYLVAVLPRLRTGIAAIATLILLNVIIDSHFLMLMNQGMWLHLMTPALLLLLGHALLLGKRLAARRPSVDAEAESAENNRMLGLAFQGQGQLDLAFDKFRKCPLDESLMDLLYNLAGDYERRRQYGKASTVYEYMAQHDPDYKDLQKRIGRARHVEETGLLKSGPSKGTDTILLDLDGVEKPMLGRYQVEKVIGRGAMGVIYQGRDPKINRVVAIKTLALAQEFDSDELEEVQNRFFREAETAGRLNHPNIVTIYDAGEEQDLAYIAMEYLTGHDLTRYTRPNSLLPLPAVFHIAIKAAEALDYAHGQNVVHRDIKPGNIIFEPKSGDVKITDFGIARITDSSKTRTGTVLGTPAYMSPEQLAGKHLDGRSDLFSLGVMFYQLVTGQLPFQAESMASLMFKITNEAHLPVISHNTELEPCIDAILDKALSKEIKWRHQSGAEMARDLRACARRVMARATHKADQRANKT